MWLFPFNGCYFLLMISIEFSEQDLTNIDEACDDPTLPEKIKRKLMCLKMHQQKVRNGAIASILNITANTVTSYIKEFHEQGISATLEDKAYRPASSLTPFLNCLECSFKALPPKDISEAMIRIYNLTGVQLRRTQTRNALHALGLKYRKTGVIPGKADPQLQFDFLKTELSPRLEEASKGERKVYFVDAAHFVLGSFLGMIWCFSRIFIKSGCGRQRYNVLGALDSHSKEVITIRSTGNINSYRVCDLIDKVKELNPDKKVTLVMDNARYQRCKKVTEYASSQGIEILFLPPYSPNLNLIERLWKHLKKKALRNQHFNCFASFQNAVDSYLDNLNTTHQEELESLLTLKFQSYA
jgi:transposase